MTKDEKIIATLIAAGFLVFCVAAINDSPVVFLKLVFACFGAMVVGVLMLIWKDKPSL